MTARCKVIEAGVVLSRLGPLPDVSPWVRGLAQSFPPLLDRPASHAARVFLDRIEAIEFEQARAGFALPEGVSDQIVTGPGRPELFAFRPTETVQTPNGPRVRYQTVTGRHAARVGDAFDRMLEQVARRAGPGGEAPFTPSQIEAGRNYAALVERLDCAGVRGSSIETLGRKGGGGGSFVDAVIADRRRLDFMRARLGAPGVVVLAPVNATACADRGRVKIRLGDLVDGVCLGGLTLSQVLARYGWGRNTKSVKALRDALRAALDRMSGVCVGD